MLFVARNATAHFQRMMDAEITQAGLQGNEAPTWYLSLQQICRGALGAF
jgi:hypothetical protein